MDYPTVVYIVVVYSRILYIIITEVPRHLQLDK